MEAKSKKGNQNLEELILQRQTNREQGFNSLIQKLSEKYGNPNDDVDDSEEYVLPETKRKRSVAQPKSSKKVNGSGGSSSSSARKSSTKK